MTPIVGSTNVIRTRRITLKKGQKSIYTDRHIVPQPSYHSCHLSSRRTRELERTASFLFFQHTSTIQMLKLPLPSASKAPLTSWFKTLRGAHGCWTMRIIELLQDRGEVSPNRNSKYGFRTFCSGKELAAKKCVPCNSKDMLAMTDETANSFVQRVRGWNLINESDKLKLTRSWKVKSFVKGLEFFKFVGELAESEGHHPDLHLIGWNNVTIEIWTHAVGGLTENDFILAAKINELNLQHLLRREAGT